MSELFSKKAILKEDDLVTVNDGDDQSTATVSHLKRKDDGSLVELSYEEAMRRKQLLQRGGLGEEYHGLARNVDEREGLGETPSWFEPVSQVLRLDDDSVLLELEHLGGDKFFIREFRGDKESGAEYVCSLKEGGEGLELRVLCRLDYDADSDIGVENIDTDEVVGVFSADIDHRKVESDEEGEPPGYYTDIDVSLDSTLEGGRRSGIRELLASVALKHSYDGERLFFDVYDEDGLVFVDVLNKDFKLVYSEGFESLMSPPLWAELLLSVSGCPLDMEGRDL